MFDSVIIESPSADTCFSRIIVGYFFILAKTFYYVVYTGIALSATILTS